MNHLPLIDLNTNVSSDSSQHISRGKSTILCFLLFLFSTTEKPTSIKASATQKLLQRYKNVTDTSSTNRSWSETVPFSHTTKVNL